MRDYATKDKLLYGPSSESGRRRSGRQPSPRAKFRVPNWLWMSIGLLIGVVCIVIAWVWGSDAFHRQWVDLKKHSKAADVVAVSSSDKVSTSKPVQSVAQLVKKKSSQSQSGTNKQSGIKGSAAKKSEPHFDFYTILPKQKVKAAVEEAQKTNAKSPRQFMLQVASYQDMPSAKAMLARLKELGLKSQIDKVGAGKSIWYRVDLEPYPSVRSADVVRHTLQNNGINGAMIRQLPKSTAK